MACRVVVYGFGYLEYIKHTTLRHPAYPSSAEQPVTVSVSVPITPYPTPKRCNRKGIRLAKKSNAIYGKNVVSAQLFEVSLVGVGTVLRLGRNTGNGETTDASNK